MIAQKTGCTCLTNWSRVLWGSGMLLLRMLLVRYPAFRLKSGQARGYEGRPDFSGLVTKPKPIFRSRLLMYVSSPFTSRPTGSNADEWMCDRCTAATCATL